MINLTKEAKEELRGLVNVADLVASEGYELSYSGAKRRGVCPFEEGSTNKSKFVASDDYYKCWACGEDGDAFKWFMKKHDMTWTEAVEKVAELAHFDLAPYRGPVRPETGSERAHRLAGEALVAIAELSFETAMALPAAGRVIDGTDVTALVAGRELGLLPEPEAIKARLDSLGVDESVRRAAGIKEAGGQFTRRWVFWAWKKKQISAGRLYGRPGPVVGSAGSHSRGWTTPEKVSSEGRDRPMIIAWDDRMYIELRARGVEHIARAVSKNSHSDVRNLRIAEIDKPPVLMVRPEREARAEAWEIGVELVATNPRVRVGEYPQVVDGQGTELVDVITEDAGTLLDWQIKLAVESGILRDHVKAQTFKDRLNKILERMQPGVEQTVYRYTIENIGGGSSSGAVRR